MNNIKIFADLWNLENLSLLTETSRGILYLADYRDQKTVLKILKPLGFEHEIKGINFLKLCAPDIAVRVLEQAENAVLLEYLPGLALSEHVRQNRDDESTHIIAGLAKRIAATPIPENKDFTKLERWFASLFKKAEDKQDRNYKIFDAAASLVRDLLVDNKTPVLLHGDLHHDNIMFGSNGLPKIIDPKGLIGDPAYEFANALRNPDIEGLVTKERIMRQSKIFSEYSGIDQKRILGYGFAYACISFIWAAEDQDNPRNSLEVAHLFYDTGVYL